MPDRLRKVSRRTVLRAGLAGSTLTIAGCSGGDDSGTGDPTDTPTETPDDDSPDETPTDDDTDDGTDGTDDGTDDPGDDETPTPDPTATHEFTVETVSGDVSHPWGLAFLPGEDRLLVTERHGRLSFLDRDDGTATELDGVPEVAAGGQGGLLDATVHPDFPDEPWVYLTYSVANSAGESTTALGRGRLDADGATLEDFERIHVAEPYVDSSAHYGSRVVFGADGMVYVTVGDRQFKNFGPDHVSQDTSNELGTILRLEPDGSIPADNPFVEEEAVDSIYSYGHRNPQGLAVHPETGDLWETEHGEEDGDEINVIRGGENYGWPVATTACRYGTDEPIGDDPFERDDVVDPVYHWECGTGGFPPAGVTFYQGEPFPNWEGDLFVGNLAGQRLGRFVVTDPGGDVSVEEADPLLDDRDWRVRDVAVAPDTGYLYLAVDSDGGPVARLVPE